MFKLLRSDIGYTKKLFKLLRYWNGTRAVLRLVWPSILLQSARDCVATAAETVNTSRLLWIVVSPSDI